MFTIQICYGNGHSKFKICDKNSYLFKIFYIYFIVNISHGWLQYCDISRGWHFACTSTLYLLFSKHNASSLSTICLPISVEGTVTWWFTMLFYPPQFCHLTPGWREGRRSQPPIASLYQVPVKTGLDGMSADHNNLNIWDGLYYTLSELSDMPQGSRD